MADGLYILTTRPVYAWTFLKKEGVRAPRRLPVSYSIETDPIAAREWLDRISA